MARVLGAGLFRHGRRLPVGAGHAGSGSRQHAAARPPSREDDPSSRRGYAAFNSVVALGAESGIYHKRHLVPFGEYVPLESTLRGLIALQVHQIGDGTKKPPGEEIRWRNIRIKEL